MKNLIKLALLGAVAFTSISFVTAADARTRHVGGHYMRANGRMGTFQRTTTRSPGSFSQSGSITNQNGRAWARNRSLSTNGTSGSASASVTRTAPNGTVATRDSNSSWDKSSGTANRSVDRTYRDGTNSSRDTAFTNNGDGTANIDTTYANRQGETGSIDRTVAVPSR